jgi:hypothetical protein
MLIFFVIGQMIQVPRRKPPALLKLLVAQPTPPLATINVRDDALLGGLEDDLVNEERLDAVLGKLNKLASIDDFAGTGNMLAGQLVLSHQSTVF